MGTAIIGDQGLFAAKDFSRSRETPRRGQEGFVGYFASLEEVNRYLRRGPGARQGKRNSHLVLATLG